jgi:hypothetical protein
MPRHSVLRCSSWSRSPARGGSSRNWRATTNSFWGGAIRRRGAPVPKSDPERADGLALGPEALCDFPRPGKHPSIQICEDALSSPVAPCGLLLLGRGPQTSGHFRLDLPPEFAHPPNRPRHPGIRGSERILLISEPAHEGARFHANQWLRIQASDDSPDIQLVHFGELPRPELVIRVIPGPVVPGAQRNGGLGRAVVVGLFTPAQVDHPLPETPGNETCGFFPLNPFFPSARSPS